MSHHGQYSDSVRGLQEIGVVRNALAIADQEASKEKSEAKSRYTKGPHATALHRNRKEVGHTHWRFFSAQHSWKTSILNRASMSCPGLWCVESIFTHTY
jgi:hypothetical protein